jgi:mono/diheme cytochrome c family protein
VRVLSDNTHPLTEVDLLTKNFHSGESLYINQGCYACHRITGFARGGVGPELTEIGNYYPWYIKESIVWPQADLKTSTMPNYKLDHNELEDLVTFLLAQKGPSKIISPSDYKQAVMDWDSGKRLPWEMPSTPAQMHDVNYGLTIFATEGCAACHRLKGFTSDVGFSVEKNNPDFDALYNARQWFSQTIPEDVSGSDIVHILETKSDEIDQYIVNNVRSGSIIEQIQAQHPGNVESFYSNFSYARRAKNREFGNDPEKLKEWQDRVWRVLMMYVQQYGYGRVVGPRPNWSGIYRSDEWLMEHFHKPSSTVARSIMPVFPFNDTKFYALTFMLNEMAVRNRDANRKVWAERGFNPETAYNLYCAQCHGDQRVGNGPVAEWIYPVPKNLRNADFMRNLTPGRVRSSIMHGVAGGPMPPWGEAPAKAVTGGIPVLTESEIDRLVDWLYSSLPGSTVIPMDQEVPKWEYQPTDVIEDLKREGSKLQGDNKLSFLNDGSNYIAALGPVAIPDEVSKVFDVVPAPAGDIDADYYYIKPQYYTPQNILAGQNYFELNCAVCHGREGDGAGNRAGVMQDAKPRMLINFPWLETRDDLRLIRSIKFGVPGTSMQPWGDQTSALQRMQLVMFIRSLSAEQKYREQIYTLLYSNYDESRVAIESGRIAQNPQLIKTQQQLTAVTKEQEQASKKAELGESSAESAATLYKKQLELTKQLNVLTENDAKYQQLIDLVYKERKIYEELGLSIIGLTDRNVVFAPYIQLLKLQGQKIRYAQGQLTFEKTKQDEQTQLIDQIKETLKNNIENQEKLLSAYEGKIPNPEQKEQILEINGTLQTLKKLRNNIIFAAEETKRIDQKQILILNELKNGTQNDNSNSDRPAE